MAIGRINASLTGVQPGGLAKIVPTSVAVGSGSGSVDSNGNVTFSGASTASINGCFTSTYANYAIKVQLTASTGSGDFRLRLRANGSDATAANYNSAGYKMGVGSASSTAISNNGGTSFTFLGGVYNSATYDFGSFSFDLFNPFASNFSQIILQSFSNDGSVYLCSNISGTYAATTSFDGFTIYGSVGNITGNVRVYGYTQ